VGHRGDPAGIDTVLLVRVHAADRVARICARARGFVYAVARMGSPRTGGPRSDVGRSWSASGPAPTCRLRRGGCVDAGPAAQVCEVADGVVVGSALVRACSRTRGRRAAAFIGSFRDAID